MEAAAALATALETTPPREQFEMRKARDGYLYTMEAFQEHYGKHGVSVWEQAEDIGATEPDGAIARDRDGIIGRALWPREMPKIALVSRNGIMVAAAICTPAAVSHSSSRHYCACGRPSSRRRLASSTLMRGTLMLQSLVLISMSTGRSATKSLAAPGGDGVSSGVKGCNCFHTKKPCGRTRRTRNS